MAEPCSKCTQEAETGQHAEPSCPECHPPVKFDPDYHLPMAVITVEEVEEMTQRIADLERCMRRLVERFDMPGHDMETDGLLAEAESLLGVNK